MARVISEDSNYTQQAKCSHCGCKFEYNKSELERFRWSGYILWEAINCPGCKNRVVTYRR